MQVYIKGKLIEGVTQVEMLKSGVVSVETIARDDEGNHLTDEASLVLNVNHYPIRDVRFGEGMVTEHHMGDTKPMKTCNDAPVGYTDHLHIGEWQPWTGGVCPVHPLCVVEYVMRAQQAGPDAASQLTWTHDGDDWDIVAYRIVEEYKSEPKREAREVWMCQMRYVQMGYFSSPAKREPDKIAWAECNKDDEGATLFREVLE